MAPQTASQSNSAPFHLVAWLIVQDAEGRILLGRRTNTSYASGLWGLPGGHVERGETLAAAAARETAEEVGLTVDPAALTLLGVTRYDHADVMGADFFFLATQFEGEARPLEATSEVGWFAPDQLPPDPLPWLAQVLEVHWRGGKWFMEEVTSSGQS